MAIPVVEDVYVAARAVLGDTRITGGQVYTDAILQPHFQFAFSELFRALQSAQSPRVRQENYFNVPANTGYLNPATAFITNLGQIETVEARINVTQWPVTLFVPGTNSATVTTSAPTTLLSGNQAVLYGLTNVSDDAQGIWTVTVTDSTHTILDGCVATALGTIGYTNAVLSSSSELFVELTPVPRVFWDSNMAPVDRPLYYAWETGVLKFPPCTTVVQLRIAYSLSGNAPLTITQSVGIDDSLGFLSYRVAGLAARARGMVDRANTYDQVAVGPNWLSQQQPGGVLNQLLVTGVRNLQRLPPSQRRAPPFGRVRNRRWFAW